MPEKRLRKPVGRFAPTPSGRLHLGNLLCAMLAYLSVKSQNGTFLLRIEDVDIPRCPESASLQMIEDLHFLGFEWDEEPVWQSRRTRAYDEVMDRLKAIGAVYPCFCTRAELMASRAPNRGDTQVIYAGTCRSLTDTERAEKQHLRRPAIRLRVPDATVTFTDRLCGEVSENLARECGDFILRRSDGLYGYQLAVVADDAFSGITEVVRGEDILSATPRQIWLQRLLGYPEPEYCHIPLVTDSEGRRLAKRDGDLSVTALSQRFSPEQIIGCLAYAAGIIDRNEAVSLTELIPLFSWEKVRRGDIRLPEVLTKG